MLFVQVNYRFMNGDRETGEVRRAIDTLHDRADVRHLSDASKARELRVAQMILESELQERFWSELRGASGFN
jgi:hypothetical protein